MNVNSARGIIAASRFREIKNILQDLDDIPYALIKGEALALLAYKDVSKRKMGGDIDFLVPRDQILKCNFHKILKI